MPCAASMLSGIGGSRCCSVFDCESQDGDQYGTDQRDKLADVWRNVYDSHQKQELAVCHVVMLLSALAMAALAQPLM